MCELMFTPARGTSHALCKVRATALIKKDTPTELPECLVDLYRA